jgi:hypothetical protein
MVHSRSPYVGFINISLSYIRARAPFGYGVILNGVSSGAAILLHLRQEIGESIAPILATDPRGAFAQHSGRDVIRAEALTVIDWTWSIDIDSAFGYPESGSYRTYHSIGAGQMTEAGPNFLPSYPWVDINPIERQFTLEIASSQYADPDAVLPSPATPIVPSMSRIHIDPATYAPSQPDYIGTPAPSPGHWSSINITGIDWIHSPGY